MTEYNENLKVKFEWAQHVNKEDREAVVEFPGEYFLKTPDGRPSTALLEKLAILAEFLKPKIQDNIYDEVDMEYCAFSKELRIFRYVEYEGWFHEEHKLVLADDEEGIEEVVKKLGKFLNSRIDWSYNQSKRPALIPYFGDKNIRTLRRP